MINIETVKLNPRQSPKVGSEGAQLQKKKCIRIVWYTLYTQYYNIYHL